MAKEGSTINTLAHMGTFQMVVTDDGAIAIGSISKISFEDSHIVLLLVSGVEIELSETATKQFIEQTEMIAEAISRQMTSQILPPGKVIFQ